MDVTQIFFCADDAVQLFSVQSDIITAKWAPESSKKSSFLGHKNNKTQWTPMSDFSVAIFACHSQWRINWIKHFASKHAYPREIRVSAIKPWHETRYDDTGWQSIDQSKGGKILARDFIARWNSRVGSFRELTTREFVDNPCASTTEINNQRILKGANVSVELFFAFWT